MHKFNGFRPTDFEQLKNFFLTNFKTQLKIEDLASQGWNWGKVSFKGNNLSFLVGEQKQRAFEIPLGDVAQCTMPSKDEVALEFHDFTSTSGDVESLVEMRFYIPNVKDKDDDDLGKSKASLFLERVLDKAEVVSGKGIVTFEKLTVLTPRGRYNIEMFPSIMRLHGKSNDFKIKYTSIVRLFHLPKPDKQHTFFVISIEPPIRQGHTIYPHLVFHLKEDEKVENLELNLSSADIKKDRLSTLKGLGTLSGPRIQVISTMFKALTDKKITMPKSFRSDSGHTSVKCSLKTFEGHLFPLESSFFFVHKPPTHIRFEEIKDVEFARVRMDNEVNRTFDFDINLKSGTTLTFTSINRKEYSPIFNFIMKKGLPVKNLSLIHI
eukprot:TRINITY_DN3578_c0_g1_i2.p1 TRINITY_DN3578_c0_g1~~TRINITY_DN3578_c0_g1_i2.p1  ORF type:complete len:379 (+),score=64.77 TRINITY_DN3578_c0_g1_i2:146-1282(+)